MKSNHQQSLKAKPAVFHKGIADYLAGAAGFTAVLAVPQADAAVTAFTFAFGPELTSTDGSGFSPIGPGFGELYSYASIDRIMLGNGNPALGGVYHNASGTPTFGDAEFFAYGTTIGAGGNGHRGSGFFQFTGIGVGFTSDQLNKNIAFRTDTNNWGWANVSWTAATNSLTINSAFVESVPNRPISVGAVPEPSVVGLLVLGAFGVVHRRRRQQSA